MARGAGLALQVVLPAGVNPGLTIHVPKGYEQGEVPRIGVCRVCGARFYKGETVAWQKHVGKCARRHIDELRANSVRNRHGGIFNEESWDPEVARHLKKVGKQMLREGRLEMLPKERANG